jgi:hypothetical protein
LQIVTQSTLAVGQRLLKLRKDLCPTALVFGTFVAAQVGLELTGFAPHQKAGQQSKDEPYDQGKRDFCHDLSFDYGYIQP